MANTTARDGRVYIPAAPRRVSALAIAAWRVAIDIARGRSGVPLNGMDKRKGYWDGV